MGRAKEAMLLQQEQLDLALDYHVRVGTLERCEPHAVTYGGGWDLEPDFWRNAMADRNRGENGSIPWAAEMEARAFTDLLKSAYEGVWGDRCEHCAKIMADD